jgi:hypothetical protein
MEHDPASAVRVSGFGTGWGTRFGAAVCLILLVVYGVLWSGMVQQTGGAENYVMRSPFLATLTGATLVAGGQGAELYDAEAQGAMQARLLQGAFTPAEPVAYTDPPLVALVLAPFVQLGLSETALFSIWAILTTTAAGLCIGLLAGGWPTARTTPWLLMLAATSFLPLIASLMLGETGVLVLLGWVGVTAGLKTGRPGIAGISALLAALYLPGLPLLVVLLALSRRLQALLIFGGLLAASGLGIIPLLGSEWPQHYAALLNSQPGGPPGAAAWMAVAAAAGALALLWARVPVESAPGPRWDRRWATSLLIAGAGAGALGTPLLLAAIIPGWIFGTHAATGLLPPGQRRFWIAWLWLGYALGLVSVLLPGLFPILATLWATGAIIGGLWSLRVA